MNKKCITVIIILLIVVGGGSLLLNRKMSNNLCRSVIDYRTEIYAVERGVIGSTPVYRDYVKPSIERELVKYDLTMSAREAVKHGVKAMRNIEDIKSNYKSGKLVSLEKMKDRKFYFHNVRKEYRFLSPYGAEGLKLVTETFQKKLKERNPRSPLVKLAVSSVVRTVKYQKKVFGREFISTHSFGACFDIFFEDFFVVLPEVKGKSGSEKMMFDELRRKNGFLLGDALRRQFRSVLSETLLELQRKGVLYVFLENDNRCYHITIRR